MQSFHANLQMQMKRDPEFMLLSGLEQSEAATKHKALLLKQICTQNTNVQMKRDPEFMHLFGLEATAATNGSTSAGECCILRMLGCPLSTLCCSKWLKHMHGRR